MTLYRSKEFTDVQGVRGARMLDAVGACAATNPIEFDRGYFLVSREVQVPRCATLSDP